MRNSNIWFAIIGLAAFGTTFPPTATAMSPRPSSAFCEVIGAEKLPAETGGAAALCEAIRQALGARAPTGKAKVVVRIRSPYAMVATVTTASGIVRPEMNFDSSDRRLERHSFDQFAKAVVEQLRD